MMCMFMDKYLFPNHSFFLLTDFNKVAELLILCPVFQKCDAMADFSTWFNESSLIKKYVSRSPDSASIAPSSNATMRDVTLQLPNLEVTDSMKI